MNPDILITIAFSVIALLVPVVALVFVVPSARREGIQVARRESRKTPRVLPAARGERERQNTTAAAGVSTDQPAGRE